MLPAVALSATWAAQPNPAGLSRTPPMGWMSWQVFRCNTNCAQSPENCISEELYKTHVVSMSKDGYSAAGYDTIHIDDCWETRNPPRDSNNRLVPDKDRFPSGFGGSGGLAEFTHSHGMKFGIYSDEGTKTCGGYPGSKGYEAVDAATWADWGVDYIKLDGCYNNQQGYPSGYAAMGAALAKASRPIAYSCSWPAYLGANETTKPFQAMIDAGCNLWRNWADIQCSQSSLSSIIDHWGDYTPVLSKYGGPGHWNDPDMLLIGANNTNSGEPCLPLEMERTQMAIWSITASPLIMGNDARAVRAESAAILLNKGAIAIDQDSMGKPGGRHPAFSSDSATQVWFRPLAGGDVAVGLYNKGGKWNPPAIVPGQCPSWTHIKGGYYEATGGADGNVGSFSGLTVEQAEAACCQNAKCAGFSYNRADGSGFYKRDAGAGITTSAAYDGYTRPSQIPPSNPGSRAEDITFKFSDVGLSGDVKVHDVWTAKDLGSFSGSFTAKQVSYLDTAFLRLSKA